MSGDLRIYGYRAAHDERKIPINEENIFKTRASLENGKRLVKKLFEKGNNPTAVFACNDLLAVGVIQGAREMGKRIPEDLSVIGFDDTILATITVPGLTTVSQPIGDMARKTLETLVRQIKGEYEGVERTLFMPTLVVRGTTSRLT
jgi:DNA-binding LacI/PurR family transcriptional regulator